MSNVIERIKNGRSLRVRILTYLMLFAVILLIVVWMMQSLLFRTSYERQKTLELGRVSNYIRTAFISSGYDIRTLKETTFSVSETNDVTAFILDNAGAVIYNAESNYYFPSGDISEFYARGILSLSRSMAESDLSSAQLIMNTDSEQKIMGFATSLSGSSSFDRYLGREYTLYVFSRIQPLESTLNAYRMQLVNTLLLVMIFALLIGIYLTYRIARPIKNITTSAEKLGRGNYDVRFEGGFCTEIDELARTLTKAEIEMKRVDEYQKDLIANVSHDLRTPLTMIKSYAEMIRDISGDRPEKREAHLKVIIDESDRLNALVTDMLNLSRMQSHRIELERSDFDMLETARSALASYLILNENEGYDIQFIAKPGNYMVNGDLIRIRQAMSNLITNAIKYCGEDKVVIVEVKRQRNRIRFSVTDHGKGIAPDEITHVWDRYYKSSTNHVRATEGTGLGLSIVKEILELHEADYDVTSKVNKGSTFWFELPQIKAKKQSGRLGKGEPEQEAE